MALIPAGSFEMGDSTNDPEDFMNSSRPVHRVELDAFYMDTREVTVGQFKQFVQQAGYNYDQWADVVQYSPTDDHPMIFVSWFDAVSYAEWSGKRLPTEAEWEYAARGGLIGQRYIWGDGRPDEIKANYGRNIFQTTIAETYPANGYELYDLDGNVKEWCLDQWDTDYYKNSPGINPLSGHNSIQSLLDESQDLSSNRCLRGGSWYSDIDHLRLARRDNATPGTRNYHFGFRCVLDIASYNSYLEKKDEVLPPPKYEGIIEWEKDGVEMVLIPRGSFEMGDSMNDPEDFMNSSRPVHRVELDAFYMDRREVTVGQFKQFVQQTGYNYNQWANVAQFSPTDNHPMIYVSWFDAVAYAEWAGKRLPTEAEWEYAARGRLERKRFSWGDLATHDLSNYRGIEGLDKWEKTSPVSSFESNGYDLYDMIGNVREWCLDWYDENYYTNSPVQNPNGPTLSSSGMRVLRGGGWNYEPDRIRVAYRISGNPVHRLSVNGFRCVADIN